MTEQNDTGGANPSYQGYNYQKLVTVWVALKLIFDSSTRTDEIIVEPASHDDVKARLVVAEEAAEASLTVLTDKELHIQVKFKGAGFWSAKDFAAVVNDRATKGNKGPTPRPRAKALLLADTNRRYVFITNTSVDDALAKGRVKSPASAANLEFVPTNLKVDAAQKKSLAGRFAIIEMMTLEETRRQIDEVLTDKLHVPTQNLDACVDRLKQLVEDRFLEVPDPLRKTNILKIAEGLGGLQHAHPQLAHYVPPANRAGANALLTSKGAVLLVGPSGYGKSLTAESLAYDRRLSNPPYKVVRETAGLAVIEEAFAEPGRVLFHLEDPWGQSGLKKDQAAEWTSRLSALIRQRMPDKQFVITSRSEIYREALSDAPAPVWADRTIVIDDAAYDMSTRREILHGNLITAGAWRQDLARQHEGRLLIDLKSPFEINAFTRELIAVDRPAEAKIDTLVDRALTDSRKHVVMDQIRGFGDRGVGGATVLWALLRHSQNLPPDRLARLRREVDRNGGPDIALDDLAQHLTQTQLTLDSDRAFAAHSKVVEALESLARAHPRTAETALNTVAKAAIMLAGKDLDWLNELQRLADAAHTLENVGVVLDVEVVDALDAFLINRLTNAVGEPGRFRAAWGSASHRLSKTTPICQLVDWLERGAPRMKGSMSFGWRPPKVSKVEREAVSAADPGFRILKGFIAHVLPWSHEDYNADYLRPWLQQFGVDLTKAFIAAGEEVIHSTQFVMSADAISECALTGPTPPYDEVWDQVLKHDAQVDAALTASREEYRQAWQGELDFAEGLAIQERMEEEGPSASHYAKGYVRARRRQEGHGWIPTHPRPDIVLPLWAELMRTSPPKVTAAELDAFFTVAAGNDSLHAEGLRIIGERLLTFSRDRVSTALTSGGPCAVEAAVRALSWLEGDGPESLGRQAAQVLLIDLLKEVSPSRAALLAPQIANLEHGKEKKLALAERVLAASGPTTRAAVHLALAGALGADDATLRQRFKELSPGEAETLMAEGPRGLTRLLLVISAAEGLDITPLATKWTASDDEDDAQAAIKALALRGDVQAKAVIAATLSHPHFKVRCAALRTLAPVANEDQRRALLTMVCDKSGPVRSALAEVIGEERWTDGLDVLVQLLGDQRNYARHPELQQRDEPEFHVARAAAASLDKFDVLPAATLDHMIQFLATSGGQAVDVELYAALLGLLTTPDHRPIWATLEHCLTDDHVVGEPEENLYPIRYAAGWAIVHRQCEHPDEHNLVPWSAVQAAADHIDPQLAAPALLALGGQMETACDSNTLQALRGPNTSTIRVALALSMIDDRDAARALSAKHGLLPNDHPLFDNGEDISTDKVRLHRWPLSAKGRVWLESLQSGSDVEATLLWVIGARTGLLLGEADFDPTKLRRKGTIPLMTLAEMFGMQ